MCVFFQERNITVYDTAPDEGEVKVYIEAMMRYIREEYKYVYGVDMPDVEKWTSVPSRKGLKKTAPLQNSEGANCGVYACLIMEMLMNKIDPWMLNQYKSQVEEKGRFALFHSIRTGKPILQNCFCTSHLRLQNCKNGPYKIELLYPLTSTFIPQPKLPYIEELAFHFSQQATRGKDAGLLPLPEPCKFWFDPPKLTDGVIWSYDASNRVVIANFTNVCKIHWKHKQYIGQLMERDDVTLITEGLVSELVARMKDLNLLIKELQLSFGDRVYHNFRSYHRTQVGSVVTYKPAEKMVTPMKVRDYVRYLNILRGENPNVNFSYVNDKGKEVRFKKATDVVFYMLDVDMTEHLLNVNAAFKSEFKLKEILPGGRWCMTNQIAKGSRTFMGPNTYISPGKPPFAQIAHR